MTLLMHSRLSAGLVVPAYTDSEEAPDLLNENRKPYEAVFLSKNPIEMVKAHYENLLGPMEELSPVLFKFTVKKVDTGYMETYEPSQLGVTLETRRPAYAEMRAGSAGKKMSSHRGHAYFRPLESMVALVPGKSLADYDKVCDNFAILTWAYFRNSDKTDSKGKVLNRGEAILSEYLEKNASRSNTPAVSMEEGTARMDELMKQGRMSEMMALASRMSSGLSESLSADEEDWEEYIRLLERIEREAFRTKITIQKDPEKRIVPEKTNGIK